MLRGYLTGGLSGLVVSAVGLGTASLIAPQPAGNAPPQRPVVESPGLEPAADTTRTDGVVPDVTADAGGAPAPSETPGVSQPEDGTQSAQTDTTPTEQPQAGEVTTALAAPSAEQDQPVVGTASDAPVLPTAPETGLTVPESEADIVLETTTPPPPEQPEVIVIEDSAAEAGGDDLPEVVVIVDDAPEDVVPESADSTVVIAEEAAPPESLDDPESLAEDLAEAEGAETEATPAEMDMAETDTPEEPLSAPEADAAESEAPATVEAALVEAEGDTGQSTDDGTQDTGDASPVDDTAAVGDTGSEEEAAPSDVPVLVAPEVDGTLPVTPSTDEDTSGGSRISLRGDEATLPGQGAVRIIPQGETEESAAPAEDSVDVAETPVSAAPTQALVAFASAFEAPEGRPAMAVILVDDGSLAGSEAALAELAFPVTVALDPAVADATDRMAAYRALGIEVMAMAEVPSGARPTDAEVALEAGFAALPEAIGLLDIGQAGLQSDRALAEQAMARLAADGRGFVTLNQGLNSGLRAADDADVPATTIYRDLDSNDQDARVIRRFLDQAAFRARQQGQVVLVARVRPDTISALTLWNTANAGGEVVLTPVSAVLLAQ